MIVLRPYQEEAKKALEEYRQKGGTKALVVAATGTGKRLMAVDYARNFKHVLFIAHRDELIEQALDDFNKEYPLNVGIIKGDKHELNQHITVSSVQTLYRRLDRIPKRLYDCVIIDECHHFMSRTFSHTALYFECDFLLGLTATPTRLDGLSMTNLFEKIVYEYPIERAIKEKYLCEIDAMRVKTDVDLSKVHTRMGDFSNEELSRTVDIPERNALIVEKYMQYANGRQGIAFGVDIMHAEHLRDAFVNKGFIAACVHSNLSKEDRRNIISSFKSGSIDIVTNCEILTEGFDYHDVGCLLMARPTKSLALYMQMIGRSTRLKSEKYIERFGINSAIILDFVDNVGKHKLINCWEIEKDKPVEEKCLISEERRKKYVEQKEAAERERRNAKIESFYKHDKRVNLLELPKVSQMSGMWKRLQPTDIQVLFIKKLGIWEDGIDYTRGQISELISNSPATEAQIAALRKFGYDVSHGCTRGQAELAFKALQDKGLVKKRVDGNRIPPPLNFTR